ncbi:hypothetical protein [Brevibacillus borstelensis]|nr:hypothetical protein [Brevibacillus borstelensis]
MFLISYNQEFNKVKVFGYSYSNPTENYYDVITFETEKDAEGF